MKSTDIIYKDRNIPKKSERSLVVILIDDLEINYDTIKCMLKINKNEVVRMVRISSCFDMIERISSYVKELGIDKGRGDRVYLYSEGRLMPYDCNI